MTLFDGARTYAPGEVAPGTEPLAASQGSYQNVNMLGRYNLGNLKGPNLVVAILGLLLLAWAAHRWLG